MTVAVRRRERRTNQERRAEAQERILDAAEGLFARYGFNAVSTKDIGQTAEVDPSLLHYYFTSKAGLYDAVIARRAERVNVARRGALEAYAEKAGEAITVAGVVRTYVQATFDLAKTGGEGYLNYLTLIAQLNSTPAGVIPGSENMPFDEVVQLLVGLLRKASPGAKDTDLYWFYHMLSGAISLSWARTGRIDKLSDGLNRSDDFAAIKQRMAKFMAAGFMAICERQPA